MDCKCMFCKPVTAQRLKSGYVYPHPSILCYNINTWRAQLDDCCCTRHKDCDFLKWRPYLKPCECHRCHRCIDDSKVTCNVCLNATNTYTQCVHRYKYSLCDSYLASSWGTSKEELKRKRTQVQVYFECKCIMCVGWSSEKMEVQQNADSLTKSPEDEPPSKMAKTDVNSSSGTATAYDEDKEYPPPTILCKNLEYWRSMWDICCCHKHAECDRCGTGPRNCSCPRCCSCNFLASMCKNCEKKKTRFIPCDHYCPNTGHYCWF